MADEVVNVKAAVERARHLEAEQQALTARIGANRDLCRMAVVSGDASPEQAEEISRLYPKRASKAKPDDGKK